MLHINAQELTFKDGPNGMHEAVFDVLDFRQLVAMRGLRGPEFHCEFAGRCLPARPASVGLQRDGSDQAIGRIPVSNLVTRCRLKLELVPPASSLKCRT